MATKVFDQNRKEINPSLDFSQEGYEFPSSIKVDGVKYWDCFKSGTRNCDNAKVKCYATEDDACLLWVDIEFNRIDLD